ncbi:lipopolysaccharide biosynthesis protein [Desulfonauticus submarinus]
MDTSQLSKKIKHGIKWQAIISVFSQVLYFVNGVILARILGPKEFGIYGMAQIISSFVWMFWQLGLNAAIVQRKEIDRSHLDTAFTISLFMGIICAILTWVSAPYVAHFFHEPKVVPLTRVIAITFVIYAFDRVPRSLLGRNLKFKEAAIPGLLNAIIYPLVAIPLALKGFGAMSFVWGIVAGAMGMVFLHYYWLFKYFDWRPRIYFDKKSAKDLLGFGVFLTMTNILNFFLWNLQKIVIGHNLGAEELGFYNKAANLSSLPVGKINSVLGNVLLSAFSKIQDDVNKMRDWFKKFNFLAYSLVSPFLIFFLFFPDVVILSLFGIKWKGSIWILRFTSIWSLIGLSGMFWVNMINAKGKSNVLFVMSLIRLPVLFFILSIGLKLGIKGIIYGLLLNSILTFVMFLFVVIKIVKICFYDFLFSVIEPVSLNVSIGIVDYFLWKCLFPVSSYSLYIQLLLIVGFYVCCLFLYFLFRKNNPYVAYLGFNLKDLLTF